MPVDPNCLCECHGEPMHVYVHPKHGPKRQCIVKRRETWARAEHTPNAKKRKNKNNARRVYVGELYCGTAQDVAQARSIEAAVLPKLEAFKQAQKAERENHLTERGTAGTVSA